MASHHHVGDAACNARPHHRPQVQQAAASRRERSRQPLDVLLVSPPGSAEGRHYLQAPPAMPGVVFADVIDSSSAGSVLPQQKSVTEPPVQQTPGFDAHWELERALRSLSASPDALRRPSWPADDTGVAASPPPAEDLPRLHSSSSSVLLRGSADLDAGLQTLTAFRAALQLRESQLIQPQQYADQVGVHAHSAEYGAQLFWHAPHPDATPRPQMLAAVCAAGSPLQQPMPPLSEAAHDTMDGMSSQLFRWGSRGSEGDNPTSEAAHVPSELHASQQVDAPETCTTSIH